MCVIVRMNVYLLLLLLKPAAEAQVGKTRQFLNCFLNPTSTWATENWRKHNSGKQPSVDCTPKPIQRSGVKTSDGKAIPRTWDTQFIGRPIVQFVLLYYSIFTARLFTYYKVFFIMQLLIHPSQEELTRSIVSNIYCQGICSCKRETPLTLNIRIIPWVITTASFMRALNCLFLPFFRLWFFCLGFRVSLLPRRMEPA